VKNNNNICCSIRGVSWISTPVVESVSGAVPRLSQPTTVRARLNPQGRRRPEYAVGGPVIPPIVWKSGLRRPAQIQLLCFAQGRNMEHAPRTSQTVPAPRRVFLTKRTRRPRRMASGFGHKETFPTAYVDNPQTNDVSVVDIKSLKEVARVPVGFAPSRNTAGLAP